MCDFTIVECMFCWPSTVHKRKVEVASFRRVFPGACGGETLWTSSATSGPKSSASASASAVSASPHLLIWISISINNIGIKWQMRSFSGALLYPLPFIWVVRWISQKSKNQCRCHFFIQISFSWATNFSFQVLVVERQVPHPGEVVKYWCDCHKHHINWLINAILITAGVIGSTNSIDSYLQGLDTISMSALTPRAPDGAKNQHPNFIIGIFVNSRRILWTATSSTLLWNKPHNSSMSTL